MNAEIFAEWLGRQGCRVVRTRSSYWYEAGPGVFQAFPYHWIIEPTADELEGMLRNHHAVALRYSTPLTTVEGKLSYHVICDGRYDLASLPRTARQCVRRGLDYAEVTPIPLARLAEEGWRLRCDTLARQGRPHAESKAWWRRLCTSAAGLPGFEAWGAIHEGELAASFLAFVCDDCFMLPYEQSATDSLEHRVNNALFYEVTSQALARADIARVFFGVESLDAPCSVDEFKFRMGLVPRPLRQRVVFHPWLAPLAARPSFHEFVQWLAARAPHHSGLSKAEGVLRFYHEGRRAPAEQAWPERLNDQRSEVLASLATMTQPRKGVYA